MCSKGIKGGSFLFMGKGDQGRFFLFMAIGVSRRGSKGGQRGSIWLSQECMHFSLNDLEIYFCI